MDELSMIRTLSDPWSRTSASLATNCTVLVIGLVRLIKSGLMMILSVKVSLSFVYILNMNNLEVFFSFSYRLWSAWFVSKWIYRSTLNNNRLGDSILLL